MRSAVGAGEAALAEGHREQFGLPAGMVYVSPAEVAAAEAARAAAHLLLTVPLRLEAQEAQLEG